MRKIPTLFRRDPNDLKRVLPEVTAGCEWVLAGEGVATRKYDGTCTMLDENGQWWARREVKPGKAMPDGFVPVDHDETTGKTVGWEPAEQSSYARWIKEAIAGDPDHDPGTYELCGPKVNGDPERLGHHHLLRHDCAQPLPNAPRAFDALRTYLQTTPYEGIVWHHPDGRMAKLKRRDFAT